MSELAKTHTLSPMERCTGGRCAAQHRCGYRPCQARSQDVRGWVRHHLGKMVETPVDIEMMYAELVAGTLSLVDVCLVPTTPAELLPHVREWLSEHSTIPSAPRSEFLPYRRTQIAELRPWVTGENLVGVSVSAADTARGSPKAGDMIARNPKNHRDQWLVSSQYFEDNFAQPRSTVS